MNPLKSKILNALLIITSLLGYLEWGGGSHSFLFTAEAEVISKLFTDTRSVLHPFTIVPLVGQLLLAVTLFQKTPSRRLTLTGMGALAVLLVFMLAIGFISANLAIAASTLPFLVTAVITLRHHRKPAQGHKA